MNLSSKISELRNFLNEDYTWLQSNLGTNPDKILEHSKAVNDAKEKIQDLSPLVYSSLVVSKTEPELYDSFTKVHDGLNNYSGVIGRVISSKIDSLEREPVIEMSELRKLMQSCKYLGDEGNFYRVQRIHDKENRIKNQAVNDADNQHLGLRKKFMKNNWRINDISDLEKLLEESDLLVERGRYLEDSELVYHGSELSNEIVSVVNNLKAKRTKSRRAKIGITIGAAITIFSLAQHYFPVEPVQNAAKNSYEWIKEKIEKLEP